MSVTRHTNFHGDWQITLSPDRPGGSQGSDSRERSPETIALEALGWILTDQPRADRLLGLTGLSPDAWRGGLGDRKVLAAVLEFLAGHEADLVAAAIALDLPPEEISAASRALSA